ncbi:MAG TPA: type II toxin-antitoxin system RelE/ParE family toxin [Myxococcales bacterium]|jgi:plasmid stabilization system protein ParE
MARIELAPEVTEDFDRVLTHLAKHAAEDPLARVQEILDAIDVLGHSPLVGRLARRGLRELVIGRRAHGYVALYRYVAALDTVFILAVRSQREAGYARE